MTLEEFCEEENIPVNDIAKCLYACKYVSMSDLQKYDNNICYGFDNGFIGLSELKSLFKNNDLEQVSELIRLSERLELDLNKITKFIVNWASPFALELLLRHFDSKEDSIKKNFMNVVLINICIEGYEELFKNLIIEGADIHFKGNRAFSILCYLHKIDLIKFVLESLPSREALELIIDSYVLNYLSGESGVQMLKIFIDHGLDPHINDNRLFLNSLWNCNYPMLKFLLEEYFVNEFLDIISKKINIILPQFIASKDPLFELLIEFFNPNKIENLIYRLNMPLGEYERRRLRIITDDRIDLDEIAEKEKVKDEIGYRYIFIKFVNGYHSHYFS